MKKFTIFTISFSALYLLAEYVTGIYLTHTFYPDIAGTLENSAFLTSEVIITSHYRSFLLTLLMPLLSGIIAYVISEKSTATSSI